MPRGGYRPGAGRKKGSTLQNKEKQQNTLQDIKKKAKLENKDPLTFMLDLMNDPLESKETRLRAASLAAPYVHVRAGEGKDKGKKKDREDKAKQAGAGKFAPGVAPLKMVK